MTCKHLIHDPERFPICSLERLAGGELFWVRPAPYEGAPTMVQFCEKRGRINSPEGCTKPKYAMCDLYEEK